MDHPSLQSKRSADLAALAANAAMIRSMQEEERALSTQRDLLEKRRAEAGQRRRGAEEHVSLVFDLMLNFFFILVNFFVSVSFF